MSDPPDADDVTVARRVFAAMSNDHLLDVRAAFWQDMTDPRVALHTARFCRERIALIDEELRHRLTVQ